MIPKYSELLTEIETGMIPIQAILAQNNCDHLLDARDASPSFDSIYQRAFREMQVLRAAVSDDPTKHIRYQAFVFASVATNNHEIASYVSDDFELIAWASFANLTLAIDSSLNRLANFLYTEYGSQRFPTPDAWLTSKHG